MHRSSFTDMEDAHDWAMTLNKRILNSPECVDKYTEVICELDECSKAKISALLSDIKDDNPARFAEKIDFILAAINQ